MSSAMSQLHNSPVTSTFPPKKRVLHEQRLNHPGKRAAREQGAEEMRRGHAGDVTHAHARLLQRLRGLRVEPGSCRRFPIVHERADDAHAVLEHAEVAVVLGGREVLQQLMRRRRCNRTRRRRRPTGGRVRQGRAAEQGTMVSMAARAATGSLKLFVKHVWCLVKPSGTMQMSRMPGRAYAQSSVSRSASPSFSSGMSTICAWNSMPAASRRSITSMPCWACRPMMRRRTSGLDACRETRSGRDVLLDDARLVLGRQVGERDERAGQEAEAEVIVAQGQRRAHVVGQLAHEAEHAGVAALLDAVEHHAGELEAPVLAFVALKLHFAGVAVECRCSRG